MKELLHRRNILIGLVTAACLSTSAYLSQSEQNSIPDLKNNTQRFNYIQKEVDIARGDLTAYGKTMKFGGSTYYIGHTDLYGAEQAINNALSVAPVSSWVIFDLQFAKQQIETDLSPNPTPTPSYYGGGPGYGYSYSPQYLIPYEEELQWLDIAKGDIQYDRTRFT